MRTPNPQAAPAANVMPLSLPYPSMAVYVGVFGKAFEIMHELTLEAMALNRRGIELWLERRGLHSADLAPLTPWDAFAAIGPATAGADGKLHESPSQSANTEDTGTREDDEGQCCGDACTSKSCSRALKSLELAVSDFH